MPGNISGGGGGTFLLAGLLHWFRYGRLFHFHWLRGGRSNLREYLIQ
jgi:hypothetical protein